QARAAKQRLGEAGIDVVEQRTASVDTDSTGSAITIRLDYAKTTAGFDALGERGTPAEDIGREAAETAWAFNAGNAAVDKHMADQLLLFLALVGGQVSIPAVTDHIEAGRSLSAFGIEVSVDAYDDGTVRLRA
ncbi:MAG: RNA 3'-terminal phosphate cyclase, partial [Salinibacter sp.]